MTVARELAPAGLRSSPKTGHPILPDTPRKPDLRVLRPRAGASSLATEVGDNTGPVGAAEGCDLLIFKSKRSQPSAAPTGDRIATGIGEHTLLNSMMTVARELAPAGLRSRPKTGYPILPDTPCRPDSRVLRPRAGASSLATGVGDNTGPVGAAEGCDLLIFKSKRSQPAAAPTGHRIASGIGEHTLLNSMMTVARELAPAGLRSSPKTGYPILPDTPCRPDLRGLRPRAGASSLATEVGDNTGPVGAAAGCDLLIFKSKRSQPAAAPTGDRISAGIGEHTLLHSIMTVARELAPAGLRSRPKTGDPVLPDTPCRPDLRALRPRAGASSLATEVGDNTGSVGAAEGCDLLIFKSKRSQPAAAPTGDRIATGIGEHTLLNSMMTVARELVPAGLRSRPKNGYPILPDTPCRPDLRVLRPRAGASSLATGVGDNPGSVGAATGIGEGMR